MKIAEIFYSIQGEGLLAGQPSVFIRTSGCNLRCRWCDTPYTSWHPEGEDMTVEAIMTAIDPYPSRYAVVTGGEPMIARGIGPLTQALKTRGYHVTIETAATVYTPVACDLASLSPKLANSTPWREEGGKYAERHERLRLHIDVIRTFMDRHPYQLKFVMESEQDMSEIDKLLGRLGHVERDQVLLMPEGRTACAVRDKMRWMADVCKSRGFRLCPRLHIELYGNTRGT